MEHFNKKAQVKLTPAITVAVTVIITVIVLFAIFADLVPEAASAGDQLGDANTCSAAGGFFNTSQSACLNGTSPADTATVAFDAIPLGSIFSGTGIIILLLMVSLFLSVLGLVLGRRRR